MNDFMEEDVYTQRSPEAGIIACKVGPFLGKHMGQTGQKGQWRKHVPECTGVSVGNTRQDRVSSLGLRFGVDWDLLPGLSFELACWGMWGPTLVQVQRQ